MSGNTLYFSKNFWYIKKSYIQLLMFYRLISWAHIWEQMRSALRRCACETGVSPVQHS
jgi:hypothetical protein